MQVQIFISIRLAGTSPQIGEILRFHDFLLYCIFSRAHTQVEPVDRFSRYIAHAMYVFSPKDGPSGVATISRDIHFKFGTDKFQVDISIRSNVIRGVPKIRNWVT